MSQYIATASAAYWRQAVTELRHVDPKLGSLQQLAPGVVRFQSTLERAEFLERIDSQAFIFLRHLHPVDLVIPMAAGEESLVEMTQAIRPLTQHIRSGEQIGVHLRRLSGQYSHTRRAMQEVVERALAAVGAHPEPAEAERLLAITLADGVAHVGLASPEACLSPWPGGEIRFRREEEQISRAKFKLLEALALFPVRYPEGGAALDLGAAPGGWTSLLLERGLQVTAVDTGEMAPALQGNPNLTILQRNVQEISLPDSSFDLITCDMSWNPFRTAELLVQQARAVRSGAHGVLTVKLMLEKPTRTIRQVEELLAPAYQVAQVKQLFHNRDEVTMHLIRH